MNLDEIKQALDEIAGNEWQAWKVENGWRDFWTFGTGVRGVDDLTEAEAKLFANAPKWLRELLHGIYLLQGVAEAARNVVNIPTEERANIAIVSSEFERRLKILFARLELIEADEPGLRNRDAAATGTAKE